MTDDSQQQDIEKARTDLAEAAVAAALEQAAEIDWRNLFMNLHERMRAAGESKEMAGRWAGAEFSNTIRALITDAQQAALDAHTQRAVEAERGRNVEWCARALERKAREVVGALHCGSENVEIREARRIARHYKDAAAYLRALAALGGGP